MNDFRKEAQMALDAMVSGKLVLAGEILISFLAQPEPCADESDCDYMPWCRIRKTCQKQARAALAQPTHGIGGES